MTAPYPVASEISILERGYGFYFALTFCGNPNNFSYLAVMLMHVLVMFDFLGSSH